ncbi:MAG: deaminase [Candidatus Methanoplasma sp.]|jgi:cytosine/adenosine deaminase-related metal-dependent hydrolase|nr:deaminase [Candidatus Methanoplasma sp.]
MEVFQGLILSPSGIVEGYVAVEGGIVAEASEGPPPSPPSATGLILPSPVNAHTHCADGALSVPPGLSIEELVAPPGGLKHRYLAGASDGELSESMRRFSGASKSFGSKTFMDFREGGAAGCRLLRSADPGAIVLGRPVSEAFDPAEIGEILAVADGIGMPSVSDAPSAYLEEVADAARSAGKIFAIHASERVREDIDLVLSLDPAFVVHMTEASDSDLLKCAEAEVPIVVCPGSSAYFGKAPPARRMLDCGADVAIGTDNAMLRPPDLRAESLSLARILEAQGGDPMDALGALLAGRRILYPDREMRIERGARADATVFPCDPRAGALSALSGRGRAISCRSDGHV